MTTLTVVLIAALGVAAIIGLVVAVLVIEARAIDRAGDSLDFTPDDAPRDDSDWRGRHDGPEPRPHRRRLNGESP